MSTKSNHFQHSP